MNTERKVKTVRCNTDSYPPFKRDGYYYVKPEDSSHIEDSVYWVNVCLGENCLRVKAYYRPSPGLGAYFIIEEFHTEELPESQYATIADVERMIREAMEKIERLNDIDFSVYAELIKEVKGNTLPFFKFVEQLQEKYTITRK